jgi:hypothetical protein
MSNITPRLRAEQIIRESDEAEKERVSESLRRYLLTAREDRKERKRLWQGIGFALLITALAAFAVYLILQAR